MSVSIYFQAHLNGNEQSIETTKILECFSPYLKDKCESGATLYFDNQSSSFLSLDINSPSVSHLAIERPCGDAREAECILKMTKLGNFVAFEPGYEKVIIFNQSTIDNCPQDMKESILESTGFELIENVEQFKNRY